jgi:pre-rRNA-processing protein TSR3
MEIVDEIPKPTLLLYPFVEKQLSKDDRGFIEKYGLSVIDAPWDVLPQIVSEISETVELRKLPNVREVQGPYKGSDLKANTAGAAAYALFIVGFREQAQQLLDIFPWKNEFIKENFKEK